MGGTQEIHQWPHQQGRSTVIHFLHRPSSYPAPITNTVWEGLGAGATLSWSPVADLLVLPLCRSTSPTLLTLSRNSSRRTLSGEGETAARAGVATNPYNLFVLLPPPGASLPGRSSKLKWPHPPSPMSMRLQWPSSTPSSLRQES